MKILVQARKGFGYNLPIQGVYVKGRPHIVDKTAQTSVGEVQNNLTIIATDIPESMTDEKFAKAYAENADKAIEEVVKKAKAHSDKAAEEAKVIADQIAEEKAGHAKDLAKELKRQEKAAKTEEVRIAKLAKEAEG